jgi:hypothetical protein
VKVLKELFSRKIKPGSSAPVVKAWSAAEHLPRIKAAKYCYDTHKYKESIKAYANCEKYLLELPPTNQEDFKPFYTLLKEVYTGIKEAFFAEGRHDNSNDCNAAEMTI